MLKRDTFKCILDLLPCRSTTVLAAIVLFSSFLSLVYGNNGDCNMDELDKYQNEPTEPLEVVCPSGYALYKVESCYDRFEELNERRKRSTGPFDRLWIWECRAVSPVVSTMNMQLISTLSVDIVKSVWSQ